jgi:hypothetical protein
MKKPQRNILNIVILVLVILLILKPFSGYAPAKTASLAPEVGNTLAGNAVIAYNNNKYYAFSGTTVKVYNLGDPVHFKTYNLGMQVTAGAIVNPYIYVLHMKYINGGDVQYIYKYDLNFKVIKSITTTYADQVMGLARNNSSIFAYNFGGRVAYQYDPNLKLVKTHTLVTNDMYTRGVGLANLGADSVNLYALYDTGPATIGRINISTGAITFVSDALLIDSTGSVGVSKRINIYNGNVYLTGIFSEDPLSIQIRKYSNSLQFLGLVAAVPSFDAENYPRVMDNLMYITTVRVMPAGTSPNYVINLDNGQVLATPH